MMFANPPLIELVAELRWVPGISGPTNPDGSVSVQFPLAFMEESLENFRRSVVEKGFIISETLMTVSCWEGPATKISRQNKLSS